MKLKHIAAVGVMTAVMLGAGATAAVAADTSNPTPSASTCLPDNHDDVWPASAQGQPGRSPGVTVWHDDAGWHVRVTHNAIHDRVFSGEILTKGELVNVTRVKLEAHDYLKVGPNKHGLVFRFNNHGHIDGFDFNTKCAPALEFGFLSDGHRVPTARIAIGSGATHPAHNPFVIKRAA